MIKVILISIFVIPVIFFSTMYLFKRNKCSVCEEYFPTRKLHIAEASWESSMLDKYICEECLNDQEADDYYYDPDIEVHSRMEQDI